MAPPSTPDKMVAVENFDTMVHVHVGEGSKRRTFEAYKGVLSFYSGYFDKALNGGFREATQGDVSLPTEDPKVFEIFCYWICTRRLTSDDDAAKALSFDMLCALWVFGDAHTVPLFQNEAVNTIHKKVHTEWVAPSASVNFIYQNTTAKSPLRKLFIRLIAKTTWMSDAASMGPYKAWCQEALCDLVFTVWKKDFKAGESKESVAKWNMCDFHVHEAGVRCRSTRSGESVDIGR